MATYDEVAVGQFAPAGLSAHTLCQAFALSAAEYADRVALRDAEGTVELTWLEYAERVARVAAGLASLGVEPGDTVGLLLRNRPEFHIVDTAVMHLGATPFSIYVTSAPEQLSYIMQHAENRVLVTERRFLDQVRAAEASEVEHLVVIDGDDGSLDLARLEVMGGSGIDLHAAAAGVSPEDLVTLIYTSGTTGPPKGVELTHENLLFTLRSCNRRVTLPPGGHLVSYLPHAHLADRVVAHYMQLVTGATVTTVADPSAVVSALRDCRPTIFMGVPRIWEKLRAALLAGFQDAEPERRSRIEQALGFGLSKVRSEQRGEEPADDLLESWKDADATIFRPIREQLGLDRAEWLITGAAPIPPTVHEFFCALGMPVCEGWGMTETSALGLLNDPATLRIGSVGRVIPGAEVRLAADGEMLFRGPNVMRGYRKDPDRTAEAIDPEGWLHTGDIGEMDDEGYVRIVDRKKDMIINSAGKNMAPANIEAALKSSSPLIGHACCIGDRRPYNVALLGLDPDAAAAFAKRHDIGDASLTSLAEDHRVRKEVDAAVQAANARLSRVEQVKRYTLLATVWLPDGDELTPTMKLKRRRILEKYAEVIDAMYDDGPQEGDPPSTGSQG